VVHACAGETALGALIEAWNDAGSTFPMTLSNPVRASPRPVFADAARKL
jgi:hypothetical protein